MLGREPTTEEAGPSEAGAEAPEGHPLNRLAGDGLVTLEDWASSALKAWVAFKCIQEFSSLRACSIYRRHTALL